MQKDSVALVLEDSNERAALMYQRLSNDIKNRVIWVKNVSEALEVLKNYKSKLFFVSLGHDFNGRSYVNTRSEDAGMEVVRWLEKQNPMEYKNCVFIIHSWNEYAAPKMYKRLTKAGYQTKLQPFGT